MPLAQQLGEAGNGPTLRDRSAITLDQFYVRFPLSLRHRDEPHVKLSDEMVHASLGSDPWQAATADAPSRFGAPANDRAQAVVLTLARRYRAVNQHGTGLAW